MFIKLNKLIAIASLMLLTECARVSTGATTQIMSRPDGIVVGGDEGTPLGQTIRPFMSPSLVVRGKVYSGDWVRDVSKVASNVCVSQLNGDFNTLDYSLDFHGTALDKAALHCKLSGNFCSQSNLKGTCEDSTGEVFDASFAPPKASAFTPVK